MPEPHFKSKEAYRKNLAYRHIHGIPYTATSAVVAGKRHKVDHSGDSPQRRAINKRQRKKEGKR